MLQTWWRRLASALRPATPLQPTASSPAAPGPASDVLPFEGPPCPATPIDKLETCPVCGVRERSPVCAFNKLVLLRHVPDERSYRSNYALCHSCGIVYASRRPTGRRYAWMLEHFEETLGRVELGARRPGKLTLSSYALDDEQRAMLRALASRGIFISDHDGISRKDYLPALLADRLSNSVHVELLGSLLPLNRPRVLEVRSRLGSISAALQRQHGAEAHAMALFPSQQFLIGEVYGIPTAGPLDYDHFTIPFEGAFDLIVANHMFTHAIRPREMLATFHERLAPGGHLYLFNEPDEREYLVQGKSMFNTLNPFHMQAFDGPSLVRALEANGFAVKFSTLYSGSHICLAQKVDHTGA